MNYRKEFPIFQNIENHYLDTAATSQKPKRVLDRITEYYEKHNGNPGRGSHTLSIGASELLNDELNLLALCALVIKADAH